MADDLEDFLRRAAERRKSRQEQKARPATRASDHENRSASHPPPREPPRSQPTTPAPSVPLSQRHITPSINTAPHLAGQIEFADDRVRQRLQETFGDADPRTPEIDLASRTARPGAGPMTGQDSESNPTIEAVLAAFSNPQSARVAFIASEIFARRF